ncbi:MAG: flagellar assembly protein FliW [bacterium]
MEIDSKPYGTIEIDESKTVTITDGLMGFEGLEEYAIIGREEEQPFEWLQSIEDPSLAFVICEARALIPDYELSILQEDYNDLGAESEDDIITYLIVVVPENPEEMTVNMKGPVVINQKNFVGKQIINQVDEYGVKHRLLDELEDPSDLELTSSET